MKSMILFVSDGKKDSSHFILQSLKDEGNYEIIFLSSLDGLSQTYMKAAQLLLFKSPDGSPVNPGFFKQLKLDMPRLKVPIAIFADAGGLKEETLQEFLKLGIKDFFNEKEPPAILKVKITDILQREKYRLQVEDLENRLQNGKNDTGFDPCQLDEISKLVDDPRTWDFMHRVISEEGPLHRSNVNQCLLRIFNYLLAKLKSKNHSDITPYPFDTLKPDVNGMFRPPHPPGPSHHHPHPPAPHHHPHHANDFYIPLGIPSRLLNVIYKNEKQKVLDIVSHLLDGPPHDVFMNILCLHIFEQFHSFLNEGEAHE